MEHPAVIREIHRRYIEAGSDIVLTNTFGANALKFHDERCSLKEIVETAVGHVKEAVREAGRRQRDLYCPRRGTYRKAFKTHGRPGF